MKDEKHHSHDYEELDKAFEKYKGDITSSLQPIEKQLATIEKALAQLDTHCDEISNQRATIEARYTHKHRDDSRDTGCQED